MKKNIDLKLQQKIYILKHIILYIHCVDLLIWSLTQLNFPVYDFSVIYYNFQKYYILKHIILYIHCVDLLIWSLT
jgi:hypothetical protein